MVVVVWSYLLPLKPFEAQIFASAGKYFKWRGNLTETKRMEITFFRRIKQNELSETYASFSSATSAATENNNTHRATVKTLVLRTVIDRYRASTRANSHFAVLTISRIK